MSTYGWTRSSACASGDCLEAFRAGPVVMVVDSKLGELKLSHPQAWSVGEWQELLRAVRLASSPELVAHVAVDFGVILCGDVAWFGLERHDKLEFTAEEWSAFVLGVQNGEFDPDKLAPVAAVVTQDQPESQPAEATETEASVAAGVGVQPPAPAPDSPVINFRLLGELRDREHPLLRIVPEIVDTYHVGVGEVMFEARTAHHLFDMIDVPRGEGYGSDLDARAYLAIVKVLNLRERLDRITTWHAQETGPAGMVGDFCIRCGDLWPCDTHRMASGSYIDEEDAPAPNSPAGRLSDQPSSGSAERADQPGPGSTDPVEDGAQR